MVEGSLIHFCADAATIETNFRTIVCKAVADLWYEFEIQVGRGKTHIVEDQTESMVAPTELYNFYKPLTHDLER